MERSSEIGNNLNESVKINVEKNNGIKERFYKREIQLRKISKIFSNG